MYTATDAADAIRQALEKAAAEWNCARDDLSIVGVVEGDVRELGEGKT